MRAESLLAFPGPQSPHARLSNPGLCTLVRPARSQLGAGEGIEWYMNILGI